jgi:homoserine dehydrogenase
LALVGVGNVGRRVLGLLAEHGDTLRAEYDVAFSVHCVMDSSGVAISDGFDLNRLLKHKLAGRKLRELPEFREGLAPVRALDSVQCDILLEASPVNLETGEPGLSLCRTALQHGLHVALANKAPLALAHEELDRLATAAGVGILYSATFCGGLPVLNIIRRDMVCGRVLALRGIFNGTTNFILDEMLSGRAYADALREAQERGIAEADPSIDVGGWDTAAKLVIAANTIGDTMITLSDVDVTGIEDVQADRLQECHRSGSVLKLVATAERIDGEWRFRVEPTPVPSSSFLGGCTGWEMAVEIESDIYGRTFHKLWERERWVARLRSNSNQGAPQEQGSSGMRRNGIRCARSRRAAGQLALDRGINV